MPILSKFYHCLAKLALPLACLAMVGCSQSEDNLTAWQPLDGIEIVQYPSTTLKEAVDWQTNNSDSVFAAEEAIRGGMQRDYIGSFPMTFRTVGPDSNGGFAGYIRSLNLSLLDKHPNSQQPLPSLATHWAFGADGKTVYYRLDPDARWSDGKPVTADDYLYAIDFMRAKEIIAPFYNNYFTEQIVGITKYDDYTIAVESGNAKPQDELLFATAISPQPQHFYKLTDNWVRDYNWKIPPVTGAYNIGAFKKGKYIDFYRNEDWWANDKKYYRHRFNPDTLRLKVIRNDDVAFRYFLKGEIDTFTLVMPRLWHGKAQGKPFDNGYIIKAKFYNDVPVPSSGMWLNSADPILQDIAVRKALAHAVNVDKVISTVLRNDYERLNTHHQGYGDYSNTSIRPRLFDLAKANHILDQAGWDTKDSNGIRLKNGQPLSLRVTYMSDDHTPRLVILRESARKAGIDLKLQFLDMSTGFKQVLEKKHQIAWMGWGEGGIAPRFWQHYHSDNANKPQTNNITNTADPIMDGKIEQYRRSIDRDERIKLAQQLEQMIYDKAIFIPTFAVPYTRSGYWRWMKLPPWMGTKETTALFSFGAGLHWIDPTVKAEVVASKKSGVSYPAETIVNDDFKVSK